MDKDLILELLDKISNSQLTKFEYEGEDFKLKLEKNKIEVVREQLPVAMPQTAMHAPQPVQDNNVVLSQPKVESSNHKTINSPIVGTMYYSATPNGEPFVTAGKTVKKGDIVCIVEAMKVMNEIESDVDGEIVEVLVKNGTLVEYGQPLMTVK